jgi:phenylalanyl-tRNA synthetase beta subunit
VLKDAVTVEFELVRTNLLAGALRTVRENKGGYSLPLKIFEVSDVVFLDSTDDVGARNERHLVAVYTDQKAGFSYVHGIVDHVMLALSVKPAGMRLVSPADFAYLLQTTLSTIPLTPPFWMAPRSRSSTRSSRLAVMANTIARRWLIPSCSHGCRAS